MGQPIYILIRTYAKFEWVYQCVKSAISQDFHDFKILFVSDAYDYTLQQKNILERMLQNQIVIFNKQRQYSLKNGYDLIKKYITDDEAIIVNLDGDDYFSRADALTIIYHTFQQTGCWLTYGDCRLIGHSWWGDLIPARWVLKHHNIRYPKGDDKARHQANSSRFRADPVFRPLHPMTFKKWLFDRIKVEDLKNSQGEWFKTCQDQAIVLPLLEMCNDNYQVINQVLYCHRFRHNDADEIINLETQKKDLAQIKQKSPYLWIKSR